MSIEEERCPKCNAYLQRVIAEGEVILACPCGHGQPVQKSVEQSGVVQYTQNLCGFGRKMLTSTSEIRS